MAKAGAAAAGADAAAAKETFLPHHHHHPPPPCYGVPVGHCPEPPAQPYLLVPLQHRRGRPRCCPACCNNLLLTLSLLALLAAAVLVGLAVFFLWPAEPEVRLSRLALRSIHVSTNRHGGVVLDVDVEATVRVYNRDLFPLDYDGVTVEMAYRGRRLGSVGVDGGGAHLRARRELYVDVRLRLDDVWVLEDTSSLIKDIAKGRIPFDAFAKAKGQLRLFAVGLPIEGKISCAVNVDVENQAIASQDCYPEVS